MDKKIILSVAAISSAISAGSVYLLTDKGEYVPVEMAQVEERQDPHSLLPYIESERVRGEVEALGECKRDQVYLWKGKEIGDVLVDGWVCGGAYLNEEGQAELDLAKTRHQLGVMVDVIRDVD